MATRLSIHANGGYDVVLIDGDEEGEMIEYAGFAQCSLQLAMLMKQHDSVADYRSEAKRALAQKAQDALEAFNSLLTHAIEYGGVEPEAVAKARIYAISCAREAMETSC